MPGVRRSLARIDQLTLEPAGLPAFRLRCRPPTRPAPGQAALATLPGASEPLRKTLFPTRIDADGFIADCPPSPAWQLGTWLDLLSPVGRGFAPPPSSRHWLLVGMAPEAARLLPLIPWGLSQGASIVLASSSAPPRLSAEVEVIPEAGPAIAWADYIAIDLPAEALAALDSLLPEDEPGRRAVAEVLVTGPMPCGTGVCAACAVPARKGWKLACIDGPVFKAADLLR